MSIVDLVYLSPTAAGRLVRWRSSSTTPASHPAREEVPTTPTTPTTHATHATPSTHPPEGGTPLRYYGQPAPHTHPHLLAPDQVTPGITKREYRTRRERLIKSIHLQPLSKSRKNHLVIIPSSQRQFMSVDVPYPFRQNTEFLYLTGFKEPDSILVLKSNSSSSYDEAIFVTQLDKNGELWEGPCAGIDGAKDLLGIENVHSMQEFEGFLAKYVRDNSSDFVLWYDIVKPASREVHDKFMQRLIGQQKHVSVDRPTGLVHELRLVKSEAELALMRRSCEVAGRAMARTMAASRPQMSESDLYARMDYESRTLGADYLAYPPVIAGGSRACTIHYIHNNQLLQEGDMVLMDAGCELGGYCSDMTRTWPVSGSFTPAQRSLYTAVLDTQLACLEACKPLVTLDNLYMTMLRVLSQHLQRLGLVPGDLMQQDAMRLTRQFCPHHVGHWLGMDVHDCSQVIKSRQFMPNMIITVEPGLYIPSSRTDVPEEYRGLGIRVEDDILITDRGHENLTEGCPKLVDQLEAIVGSDVTPS